MPAARSGGPKGRAGCDNRDGANQERQSSRYLSGSIDCLLGLLDRCVNPFAGVILRCSGFGSTILSAIDIGYEVIVARDAICSSSDESHDALLNLYEKRFSVQVTVAEVDEIVERWRL